ncbi:LOB domain-containing protein 6 [Acorus calamus]|uniref:LOB domain-containing protein 6 n=1 Tax=Acorus calamus TaxID=4465 RepID=A0AAV9F0U1_ACOCL|nr:LOB domain-containing protein 6 [Acorus calamus]
MASSATAAVAPAPTSSPCAACKFLRRKCQLDCVFAPYFPPDQPQKFANVHKVFGASNVTKLLNELHPMQREDAVNSLAYEADMRLRDPVYGCVGVISLLQHQLRQLQIDLSLARSQLSKYQSGHHFLGDQHQILMRNNFEPDQMPVGVAGAVGGYGVVAANGVVYDGGMGGAMNGSAVAGLGIGGGLGPFARYRVGGGDEQQVVRPS